jgi:hypothetical protein
MARTLESVMAEKGISDAALGAKSGLLRGQIHAYRTRRKIPKGQNALAVIAGLKKLGADLTLEELIGATRRRNTGGPRNRAA